MTDLTSIESIVKAANRCVEALTERIQADPDNPLVPDLERVIAMAQQIIHSNERRTT